MKELADVIFALVSNPVLLHDAAKMKQFLLSAGIAPSDIKALLQVLHSFNWEQQTLADALHHLTLNANNWDPSHDWLGVA